MTAIGWIQIALYFGILLGLAIPLGDYMARVYEGHRVFLSPVVAPLERIFYRAGGIDPDAEMSWKTYTLAVLAITAIGLVVVYGLQRLQGFLPWNPARMGAVSPDSSFNTATSFVTNTNWQGYGGETTMSYFTQMAALTVQNFVSAAIGMAVLAAVVRGIARQSTSTLGNFWVDLVRGILYVLLPLAIVLALILAGQGVVQTLGGYVRVPLLEPLHAAGRSIATQLIAVGPAASQIAIKQLGTNGGGFFNVNSAHPFENPTALSNFLEMLAILLIPAALCQTFGRMVKDLRQGWLLLAVMLAMLVPLTVGAALAEQHGNPVFAHLGIDQAATRLAPGGNMEGKEARFGPVSSAIWASATTAASNGSVNAMLDSFTPLGGLVPLFLLQLGEVVFGGVGTGLYTMLAFVVVAVFVAGLLVGRTPEYLGKKIEAYEMKMAALAVLLPSLSILVGTAIAVMLPAGQAGAFNPGPHGFSEILYGFTSASENNGSAFAGLDASTPFYNTALAVCMFVGRYAVMIPMMAIAGSLASKKTVPVGAGTLPTHTVLFGSLLVGVVVIVGALTFFPALALGPIVEHLILFGRPGT